MIVRLSGVLAEVLDDSVILERDGLAREVLVPRSGIVELAPLRGSSVTLHTLEYLEGGHNAGSLSPVMIGFTHEDDRRFYLRFIEVKGIGPRKALKALAIPSVRIAAWIKAADVKALATLPGIGRRAAELIVATLREKLDDLALTAAAPPAPDRRALNPQQHTAVELMVSWGDSRADVEHWIEQAARHEQTLETAEDWVRAAYRARSGG